MMYYDIFVVIRFQICIFDILNTAGGLFCCTSLVL